MQAHPVMASGLLPASAMENQAAMNILLQVVGWTCVFSPLGHLTPGSGIAWSCTAFRGGHSVSQPHWRFPSIVLADLVTEVVPHRALVLFPG